ncbi:DUF262 domain-containing protein [Azospirillum doebereinerae]
MVVQKDLFPLVSETMRDEAERQIKDKQKIIDYDIREFPVDVIIHKFCEGLEDDKAELFIPDYQRELVWTELQQSRFIESILLNLPIPYLFVADTSEGSREGRLEIVDGVQRVRTLVEFVSGRLKLNGLDLLDSLNGFRFEDLSAARQLRFKRKTLRMIELTEQADEEARRLMFDRLNSGGTKLVSMEKRMGSQDGPFLEFVRQLAGDHLFMALCPVSTIRQNRREYEELVLRFFAYTDRYKSFDKRVDEFLTDYLKSQNEKWLTYSSDNTREEDLGSTFRNMLSFVASNIPHGFKKSAQNTSVPRIRFEAISVGVALALKESPALSPPPVERWLNSHEFLEHTRSDASNSRPKVINRIHFVRDNLLGRTVEYDQNDQH